MFNIPTGNEIITKSSQTLQRFPLTFLSSFILTCIVIYFIESEVSKMDGLNLILAKVALSASLAIFVFTGLKLFTETLQSRWSLLFTLGVFIGLTGYYLTLPQSSDAFNATTVLFRHFFLTLLFFVAFLWAPFTRTSLNNEDYWEYAKGMLFAFSTAFSFTVIVVFGVNVALYAVEKLFDLDIESKLYFELDIFLIGLFSVGYFLRRLFSLTDSS